MRTVTPEPALILSPQTESRAVDGPCSVRFPSVAATIVQESSPSFIHQINSLLMHEKRVEFHAVLRSFPVAEH